MVETKTKERSKGPESKLEKLLESDMKDWSWRTQNGLLPTFLPIAIRIAWDFPVAYRTYMAAQRILGSHEQVAAEENKADLGHLLRRETGN